MRLALCPRRQNRPRGSGKIEARTLHIALHYAVNGDHLTRHLCVPGSASVRVRTSEGSKNSVPEKVDHREIAVPVQMVDKVKLLLASEPSEACEPRSFGVVLLVKKYVCAERHRAGGDHYDKQSERKNEIHCTCDEDCRDQKVGSVVAVVATIRGGHQMALGIVCVMEPDVVSVEGPAKPVMTEAVMQ